MVDVTLANVSYDQLDNFDLFQDVQFDDIFSEIIGESEIGSLEFGSDAGVSNASSDFVTSAPNYQIVKLNDPMTMVDTGLDYYTADSSGSTSSSPSSNNASPVPQDGSPSNSHLEEIGAQFSFADAEKLLQASGALPSEPISIILPETEKDGVKITSEIILNFDQIDQNQIMHGLNETLDLDRESQNENDTCINLNQSGDMSDDDDDMDDPLPNVVLSEEEKKVFIKEGYQLPTHMPMTKSEEKLLKLVRRKIRNKKSAHVSRERKKKYIDGLEKRVDQSTKENKLLQKQIELLKSQNQELVGKLKTMQECVSSLVSKHKRSSTAVLFISLLFAFFAYPYLEIGEIDPNQMNNSNSAVQVYSRALDSIGNSVVNVTQQMIQANGVNISPNNNYETYLSYYKKRYDM